MKLKTQRAKIKIVLLFTVCCLLFTLIGCDAFVRKFTRKPKKKDLPEEEMILVPQEYEAPVMTKEEEYQQYLLLWQSWQDELLDTLLYESNHKKQVSCADEAIKNLEQLRTLLNEDKQKKLDVYILRLKGLKDSVIQDVYGANNSSFRLIAEEIKRAVIRDFAYHKIKGSLP